METIAKEARGWFERAQRTTSTTSKDGNDDVTVGYWRRREGAPEWVADLVYSAHGDFLPDDWRYAAIVSALDWLSDGNDPDDITGEWADSEVDVYTGALLEWAASSLLRVGYVDDAMAELGDGRWPDEGLSKVLQLGQYTELGEVGASVRESLVAVASERDDSDDREVV